ncbi:hypothetical protein M8J75_007086 [Diaphorina citri]|nr:hypothetical protein M8J75_007086 [Diaphorina citri]
MAVHRSQLLLSLVLTSSFFGSRAYDSFPDEDPNLTEEIERLTPRPYPRHRTPPGMDFYTKVTMPEAYYEAEYADKPCQDAAEGQIVADKQRVRKVNKLPEDKLVEDKLPQGGNILPQGDKPPEGKIPKVIVDTLNVSNVNGVYRIQQNLAPIDTDEKKIAGNDVEGMPIGDVKPQEGAMNPIGDNVEEAEGEKPEPVEENAKPIEESVKPIGDNVKGNEELTPVKPIGDNIKNEELTPNEIVAHEEQVNMEDILNGVRENVMEEKKDPKTKLSDLKPLENMRNLYNIAEETRDDVGTKVGGNKVGEPNKNHESLDRNNVGEAKKGSESLAKTHNLAGKSPLDDIQIKIKLEPLEDAKVGLNKQVNSLVDLARNPMCALSGLNPLSGLSPLSGLGPFRSLVDKMMPLSLRGLNGQPSNFFMKYFELDPKKKELRYEYFFYQQYVNRRYNDKSALSKQPAPSASSLLLNKLLGQMLPMSLTNPLSLLNPLGALGSAQPEAARRLPIRIFINEASVAKHKRSLDAMESARARVKRDASAKNESELFFNEGPFKVDDPVHLEWGKNFVRECRREGITLSSINVKQQQPLSTDPFQWYHPMPGDHATYYTVEPTVTRKLNPDDPGDLCECQHMHHFSTVKKE